MRSTGCRRKLADRLPRGAQLAGAQLQGMELIPALPLPEADFTGADLDQSQLDNAILNRCQVMIRILTEASLDTATATRADFHQAEFGSDKFCFRLFCTMRISPGR